MFPGYFAMLAIDPVLNPACASPSALAAQGEAGSRNGVAVAPYRSRAFPSVSTEGSDLSNLRMALDSASHSRLPFMIGGAAVFAVGGALGVQAACEGTASHEGDCTGFAIVGGAVGALGGVFIGKAVSDIVLGKDN